ncbi:translation initiation factor IF-2 N-terminal domain-containing protein [Rhodococcus sp. NPDC058521]|uniref:translation initiation factor IF-2 N-terminal domain-containing protein n=1 Tax=Rhodococcus sp. NPDC058521 TaxID=3346536 RepID=UPI0036661DEF
MAELEPPINSVAAGSETPDLPAKIRVHALAKLLGVTSKQVIAEAAKLGTELRSAQSSVLKDAAEQIRAAVQAPAAPDLAVQEETAREPVVTEPVAEAAAALGAPASDVEVNAEPSLFTPPAPAEEVQPSGSDSEDAGSAEPVAQVPLFLQPDLEAAPRRRRSRRDAAAPDLSSADSGSGQAKSSTDDVKSEDDSTADSADRTDGDRAESDDDQPRRRRRGRRGRGRGRGEQTEDAGNESESDSDKSKSSDSASKNAGKDGKPADSEGDTAETKDADSEKGAESEQSDGESGDGESGEGNSRRRRRRRRRKSGGDSSTDSGSEDDPPNTVVHEREPRNKNRSKDEVQGITGSTRLEAKRQRRRDGRDAGRRRPPILSESEFLARRESVDRVMVVRDRMGSGQPHATTQVAVLEDSVLVEHFVTTSSSASMVGNVYLGRVQNVLPSMEAAFIDIGRGRNGVLYAGEVNWEAAGLGGNSRKIEQALKPGDQVLVQVSKDPVGHKGARLTTQISLAGRFLVYVPGGTSTGISRKLPDTERKRLKDILRDIVPADAGVIIRTASEGVSEEELARDVARLQKQWSDIEEKAAKAESGKSGNPQSLYEEPDLLVKVIRDLFNEDFSKLVIEGEKAWSTVHAYIESVASDLLPRLEQYTSDSGIGDVFAAYRIDEQLAKALDRKVWLPSGGTLVIDRTEAMTVVDVNTGKFTGAGGNLEETVTRNNLEAAEEVVRQMRLRDIGGMIVVDFIDMVLEANRDLVLRRLTEALGRDRTRHQVSEVTSLGLVQMTRKKLGTGLVEAFSTNCEHCHGRGIVVHADPVEVKAQEDSGSRSGSGGSRKRRGRDKNSNQADSNGQSTSTETSAQASTADATVKRAHPVALAMAHHLHDEAKPDETDAVAASESVDEVALVPAPVASVEAPAQEVEAPAQEVEAPAQEVEAPAQEVEAEADTSSAPAPEPVAESVNSDTAAAPTEESGPEQVPSEKPRRRSRRASRAAAAPTGDRASEGTVVVIPASESAPEPEPDVQVPAQAEAAVSTAVAGPPARPRRRRAAARPAGPPVDNES